jgi:hypothetical protein
MIQALFVLASAVSVSAFVTPARTAAQSGLRMVADELIGACHWLFSFCLALEKRIPIKCMRMCCAGADVETGGLWDPLGEQRFL